MKLPQKQMEEWVPGKCPLSKRRFTFPPPGTGNQCLGRGTGQLDWLSGSYSMTFVAKIIVSSLQSRTHTHTHPPRAPFLGQAASPQNGH